MKDPTAAQYLMAQESHCVDVLYSIKKSSKISPTLPRHFSPPSQSGPSHAPACLLSSKKHNCAWSQILGHG